MYTKVPAAMLVKITWTKSLESVISMPIAIPTGEEIAKEKTKHLIIPGWFSNVLIRLIPKLIPAIPLCTKMAINIPKVFPVVLHRPRARPSKNE